jgi:myo-inositol-1-phosphate synthase
LSHKKAHKAAQLVANNAQDLSIGIAVSPVSCENGGENQPMPVAKQTEIRPAEGKLGVLLVGLGAVSTTFIAGVEAIKKGFAQPIGSLTQMGTVRLGKRTDNRVPLIKDLVPLADLKDLVFGAWDIFPDSAYDAALNAGVLEKELLAQLKEPLRKIKPMKAVFDQAYVKRLSGTNVKTGKNKFELAEQLIDEIAEWKRSLNSPSN